MMRGVAILLTALALGGAAPAPSDSARVTVTITEVRNAKGLVRACLTSEKKGFPDCAKVTTAHSASVDARKGTVTLSFTGVAPGRYAISVLHDANANGKADMALGLFPKEGFGFSRDAPVRMGPPSFEDAAFDIGAQDRSLTIRMRYML